jgi:hypothetical protein
VSPHGNCHCKACLASRLLPGDLRHGTLNGYINYRCRCDPCRAAKATYRPPGPVPHGTLNGYNNHQCHCEACRAALAAYTRGYRARKRGAR